MKNMKDFLMPIVVLTAICLVVSGALAFTYQFTAPIIAQGAQAEADKAKLELLPEADSFEEVAISDIDGLINFFKAKNGAGYVATTVAQGFGGGVNVMTGISADGKVTGVKLMENQETPGLGTKCGDPAYTEQYIGKDMNLEGVEAISGATVTSTAFKKAVTIAFVAYGKVAGVEVTVPEETPEVNQIETIFPEEELTPAAFAGFQEVYTAANGGLIVVWPTKGYEDKPMDVIVGINPDGTIAGVRLGKNEQTQGIGTQCGDPAYTDQYVGKTDTADLDAVSGATVTSDAFRKAVKDVLANYEANGKHEGIKVDPVKDPAAKTIFSGEELTPIEMAGFEQIFSTANGGVVIIWPTKGYEDHPMNVIVGLNADGTIAGVRLGKNEQTQGIGTQCAEPAYTDQYIGKTDTADLEAVSGATVTSDAFRKAVKEVLAAYNAAKGE